MASSIFLLCFLLILSLSSTSLSCRHLLDSSAEPDPKIIQQACQGTRYPDVCVSMLGQPGRVPSDPKPVDVIQSALSISIANLNTGVGMVQNILESSSHDTNRSKAAQTCLVGLQNAAFRSASANDAISRGSIKDARAWTSAALGYQYGCWSGLKYVNDSSEVNKTMSYFDTTLIVSTSNALSMMRAYDALGGDISLWAPPKTERDGFWEPVSSSSSQGYGSVLGLVENATVCKGGGGSCYGTVQEAVDAAEENLKGENRFVIRIKEGVYDEIVRVSLNKTNLVFLGDGKGKTVITGSISTGLQGITTYDTATVGNQDTLYVHSLRQLYNNCTIEGNIDFIFGNAAAIFQDCTILIRPRQVNPEKGETNTVTAHGRTDPAQTTGFSFIGCLVNGTDDYMRLYHTKPAQHRNYLGRPWKMFSRTVYINCTMEALISTDGWLEWDGDFALTTLYYGEYGNVGIGADLSKRVTWSSQIPAEHVSTYYVQNFLQGDEWINLAS